MGELPIDVVADALDIMPSIKQHYAELGTVLTEREIFTDAVGVVLWQRRIKQGEEHGEHIDR